MHKDEICILVFWIEKGICAGDEHTSSKTKVATKKNRDGGKNMIEARQVNECLSYQSCLTGSWKCKATSHVRAVSMLMSLWMKRKLSELQEACSDYMRLDQVSPFGTSLGQIYLQSDSF